jgi:hypothetical protein
MNVLRGVLYFFAGVFVAVPLVWMGIFGFGLVGALGLAVGSVLAYFTYKQAQTFEVQASDSQKVQLEQTYRQLAEKNSGVVGVSQLVNATGMSKDQIQGRMRELVGKGICDLDFAANGEMQYKLTPLDGARAELAQLRDK